MRVERPPLLWDVDVLDEPFIRLLGELIVVGLLHHDVLGELTLSASNVTFEGEPPDGVALGDYVAITVLGPGDWERDAAWTPASTECLWRVDLDAALRAASASYAYLRTLGEDGGSITVWFPRASG
jgi:hypothetical protein